MIEPPMRLFLYLHEKRARLGATDNIRFYLYRVLRIRSGGSISWNRSLIASIRPSLSVNRMSMLLVEEQLMDQQKRLLIHELNKLPKRQKEILYLVYMKGLSYPQAAKVMNITIKSVYNFEVLLLTTDRHG